MTSRELHQFINRRPGLLDGAMGTQLMLHGLSSGECGERWNLEHPDRVEAIHRAYREAGCDFITTNTFGATPAALERHELAGRAEEINRAGAEIARRACNRGGWVLGDVGPFGGLLEPAGDVSEQAAQEAFARQISGLKQGEVDGILVETMADPAELALAVRVARSMFDGVIMATFAFTRTESRGFRTIMGTTVGEAIAAAVGAGADVVGANCGTNMRLDDYRRLGEEIVEAAGNVPVLMQPNAGSPRMVEGKLTYPASPGDMARLTASLLEAGVRLVGGCCGTTPEQLRAMAGRVKRVK